METREARGGRCGHKGGEAEKAEVRGGGGWCVLNRLTLVASKRSIEQLRASVVVVGALISWWRSVPHISAW